VRRSSSFNTGRIDHLIATQPSDRFDFMRADMTDSGSLVSVLQHVAPDEVYNLAAQSHVRVSFDMPLYTIDVAALGTLRLLDAIRTLGLACRVYQAGSSEMFGATMPPQSETSPFNPRSPYAIAKVAAHQLAQNYRDAYGIWIANGILFNHESPRRGETFLSRKLSIAVARISLGIQQKVSLGNLDARRDWGYAPEYVEAMWRILQQSTPGDYVIATGESHTNRQLVEAAFGRIGRELEWGGSAAEQLGRDAATGQVLVDIDPRLFRPTEVQDLRGDASRAAAEIGWVPQVRFDRLIEIMVDADLRRETMLLQGTSKFNEAWRTHI
jgi:GDPmannose 4,6-dehydratase